MLRPSTFKPADSNAVPTKIVESKIGELYLILDQIIAIKESISLVGSSIEDVSAVALITDQLDTILAAAAIVEPVPQLVEDARLYSIAAKEFRDTTKIYKDDVVNFNEGIVADITALQNSMAQIIPFDQVYKDKLDSIEDNATADQTGAEIALSIDTELGSSDWRTVTGGAKGDKGDAGDSAYQVWLDEGNTGTEADFIQAITGADGIDGTNGTNGTNGNDGNDGQSITITTFTDEALYNAATPSAFELVVLYA